MKKSIKLLTEITNEEMRKKMTVVTTIFLGTPFQHTIPFPLYNIRQAAVLKLDKHRGLIEEMSEDYSPNLRSVNNTHSDFYSNVDKTPLGLTTPIAVSAEEYERVIGEYRLDSKSLSRLRKYISNRAM